MEVDKFGRTRANDAPTKVVTVAERLQMYSRIQELERKFDEKHLNQLIIEVKNDTESVRIKNILTDNQSNATDVANINFVKEYVDSLLESIENKLKQIELKLDSKMDIDDVINFVNHMRNPSDTVLNVSRGKFDALTNLKNFIISYRDAKVIL